MDKTAFRVVCVLFVVLIILLLFGIRYLRNKENMAMIERGMAPHNGKGLSFNKILIYACSFFGVGFGLLAGYFAGQGFMRHSQVLAHFIFVSLFVGTGFLVAYRILEKSKRDDF